jgi:integrase
MALAPKRIGKLKKPGRYKDSESRGLYLQVGRTGSKSWLLRFELDGRERFMGLGSFEDFSLKEARQRARQQRQLLSDGVDPIEARLTARDAARKAEHENITFKDAAAKFISLHEAGWKNAKHRAQWRSTLAAYAYPQLGARPVKALDDAAINAALAPIWQEVPETSGRVRQRIDRVIAWVKAGMPLPKPKPTQRARNHPALPYAEIPLFMAELRDREGISARALEFLILTAARTAEVIGATWNEFDLLNKLWTIPAERMKASRGHRVPLSDAAIDVLKSLPKEAKNPHVFIGGRKGQGLSNMAMLELLRGMRPGLTVHGFRSTFKDWASETTSYANIISEMALAHTVGNKVEAAYRRGDLLEKRKRLMRDWAKYCASTPARADNVVTMGAHR